MLELKITQLDYEDLANQICECDMVRFHLDASGEIHYPHNLELSVELEVEIIRLCGEIGPDKYLTVDWWDMTKRLYATISCTKENTFHSQVSINIIEEKI